MNITFGIEARKWAGSQSTITKEVVEDTFSFTSDEPLEMGFVTHSIFHVYGSDALDDRSFEFSVDVEFVTAWRLGVVSPKFSVPLGFGMDIEHTSEVFSYSSDELTVEIGIGEYDITEFAWEIVIADG